VDEAGGELIGLLVAAAIVIAIVVMVIAAIIFVGIFLLAGIAIFGTASGLFIGTRNFSAVLKEAHRDVPRSRPSTAQNASTVTGATDEQPAYLLYPRDRGWRVMTYVRSNLFARTANEAKGWFTRGAALRAQSSAATENVQQYWLLSAAGGFYLAGLAQFLAAQIIVAVFMVVHVAILAIWYAVSTAGIFFIGLYTKAYGDWYKAHYRCPGCHESMEIPVFICPTCATDHTRLWPSEYGVLHHTCSKCGTTELPTTDRNGRKELARKCPYCSRPLNADIGLLTNVHIPIVGGPSSGKSNLIVMATNELMHSSKALGGATFTFPDPVDEREFQASLQRLQGGLELVKTPNVVPQAFNLSVKRPRDRVGKVVYFYDAAGEAYGDEASALAQTYYEYVHGLLFVIDPFGIPSVRAEFDKRLDDVRTSLRPSPIAVMDSYERMLTVLEASVGLKRGQQFPHPLAVILTKVDAFDLESKVGAPAARSLRASDPKYKSEEDAIDFLVRQFLGEHRLDHFVRDAEHQFEKVRFFSCSALGRMPNPANTAPFTPVRVLEPLAWVLEELDVLSAISVGAPAAAPVQVATATA
jgi:Zn ribbon nucleic-acid-binding protein